MSKSKHKDITDAQVLTQLRLRKLRLQLELDRVNYAIKAFENIKDIDPLDAALYSDDIVTSEPLADDTAAHILLYNPKATMENKILFVLDKIKFGDTTAITEFIVRIDGHIKDVTRLFNNVTYVASRLYNAGRIDAEKTGKRNVYKLKE